jgi:CHAT domain-containing protein
LVTRETLIARTLPGRATLEELARRAGELLPRSKEWSLKRQADLAAEALSRVVLGPVARDLGTRRLLVVVDGALQAIPFAALPTPGSRQPLILDREVVQLPSASVLAFVRETAARRPPARHQLAVVADPVFGRGDPRLATAPAPLGAPPSGERAEVGGGFLRLPATAREAATILRLAPPAESFAALGLAANRDTVLGGRLAAYRIVHFATHSVFDALHPELSALALSTVDRAGRPREGLLRAYEIYDLRLPAELVVLSACRTAVGPDVRGEGMMSLTRAFLHAGAARVLVSLWNVDDAATAELMGRFYTHLLQGGMPPSRALREAQLSMLHEERWSSPLYWAGFTLQGDWG